MSSEELLKTRIKKLNEIANREGECVLYVMSRDQRVRDNHALLIAQKHALASKLPLCVVFCLYDKVKGRAREQFQFMIDGLYDVETQLKQLNIPFMMLFGSSSERIASVIHHTSPAAVYFDFSPLRGPRAITEKIAAENTVPVYVVDTHNMVPVWIASEKREVGARTLRTKIHKKFTQYLDTPEDIVHHLYDWPGTVKSMKDLSDRISETLNAQQKNKSVVSFDSGESVALKYLDEFVTRRIEGYVDNRNDPSYNSLSGMSPYLHFGQLSSLRVALEMKKIADSASSELHLAISGKMPQSDSANSKKIASANALLEEMIVRKELSDNFCYYENNYDSIASVDNWAKLTIQAHDVDERKYIYGYDELASCNTHDSAWNAAQSQMMKTGKMHGYMRMYWAKKIKEWTIDAKSANQLAIKLNDFYSIDGGDPNGYVGILWAIAGVHDRAWTERDIFGKVRYMNYAGLKRKFDIEAYEKQWNK